MPATRRVGADGRWALARDWLQRVHAWQAAFADQPGRWALQCDDTLDAAAALLGAWLSDCEPWLCPDSLPATLDALSARVQGFAGDLPAMYQPLQPKAPRAPLPQTALDETRTRLTIFTSGSTGSPLAIGKTLAQLTREIETLEACFGAQLDAEACVLGTVSHQHVYGVLFRMLWPLAAGRPIAARLFFHEELLAALGRHHKAVLVSSPAHLKRIPDTLDWAPLRGHLQGVFSSGGVLPQSAVEAMQTLWGRGVMEVFGSSESGGVAWRLRGPGHEPAWTALPGVEWRISAERLEIRSPHLPDTQWWRSEDRAETCGEGFVLLGRADRIVKIEERRLSLDALQRALCALDQIEEARVLLMPGARQRLAAVIVLSPHGLKQLQQGGRRALLQHLSRALAGQHDAVTRPRLWRLVEALPVNAQGKITEAALRALFETVPLRPQPRWITHDATRATLEVELGPDLVVFDGHFPQAPILPGVAQLDWAIGWAREVFALPPDPIRIEALKFQRLLRPGNRARLELEWQADSGLLRFVWTSALGTHASGRILWATREAGA